jgi:hypothetical protein
LLAAGCSGETAGGPPSSTCTTPAACPASPTDLSGTWDLVGASQGGTPEMGTISIASNVFILTISDAVLSYTAQGDALTVTWTENKKTDTIATSRTPLASSFTHGIFPLDLSGTWSFSDPMQMAHECGFNGALGAFNAQCAGTDEIVPTADLGKIYVANRTQTLSSVFGDFGGVWTGVVTGADPSSGCTFTFKDSTISSSCADGSDFLTGTATVTFQGTTTASGNTGNGVEYSAKKR